jgi:3-dehydroquinate synthase class II
MARLLPNIPHRMVVVLKIADETQMSQFLESEHAVRFREQDSERLIVGYSDPEKLCGLRNSGYATCLFANVLDQQSLLRSISEGRKMHYVSILFRDPTNIPLELVIASLQGTESVVIKQIQREDDVDDAIVSLGVMESGADGIIFSPTSHQVLDQLQRRLERERHGTLELSVGSVIATRPVGMGFRACIDTATLFGKDEGMLVGSTSQGGLLCCPEVFFLPYMDLRPFRVNAGAIHSYVYGAANRTAYMSELKVGSSAMLVTTAGRVRTAPIGRMKIEQRPLRLIQVEFSADRSVNVLMQDDWHVRIFSDEGLPLNISEIKPGDKVLGHVTAMGRHVGIKIDEAIIET